MRLAAYRGGSVGLLLLLVCWSGPPAQGGQPRPYRLAVEVVGPDGSVPESLREEFEGGLLRSLDVARCFAAVGPATEEGQGVDLLLRAVLQGFNDETRYDVSQAARDDPRAPPETKQALNVLLDVDLELQLLTLPDERLVRRKHQHLRKAHRPVMFEDPRDEATYKLVEALADVGRSFACKGSASKLAREIEGAEARPAR